MKHYINRRFGLIALCIVSLAGCSQEPQSVDASSSPDTTKAIVVETRIVSTSKVPLKAVVPGAVVPDQKANIASRMMGYIERLDVEVGDQVEQGQLLFKIDARDVQNQIIKAQSGFQQARASLKDASADYKRFAKLYQEKAVSKQQFEKMRLQYNVAQENLAAAEAGLKQAKDQLNYANVKAPFSGVIIEKMASEGSLAAPGNPVVVMENLASLSVQTQVSNDLYAVLRVGDKAQVKIDGISQPFEGTIYTLVSSADPQTRTHKVKLSLPNINDVNSGTFARVSFTRGERETFMLPRSAIVKRAGIEGVFIVEQGKSYFHMVRLGATLGDQVEVQSGLIAGEKVVIASEQGLMNGDLVEVQGAN